MAATVPAVGAIVEAHSLSGMAILNGQCGKVLEQRNGGEKGMLVVVDFPQPHGKMMVRVANCKVVGMSEAPLAPAVSEKEKERQALAAKYPNGTEVQAVGLKTQSHLNGTRGRVDALHKTPDGSVRVVVDFGPPSGLVALRAANLQVARRESVSPAKGEQPPSRQGSTLGSLARQGSVSSASGKKDKRQSGAFGSPAVSPPGSPVTRDRQLSTTSSSASLGRSSGQAKRSSRMSNNNIPAGMVTYQDRFSTFASWPKHKISEKVNPRQLATAGFYHNPSQREPDRCTCFTCGYSLVDWGLNDVPWEEHSRHVKDCAFVQAHRASMKAFSALSRKKRDALAPLDEEGYLKKQKPGKFANGWDERFFALRGTTLYYYEEKAQIDLSRGCECSPAPTDTTSFTVNAVGQTRDPFVLRADDQYERTRWMEALNGSKQRDISKEDMEVLMGFETAEAETRTQLIFEASQYATDLAGACIANSMRLSSVIEVEFRERIDRSDIWSEQLAAAGELRHLYAKRRTTLRNGEFLAQQTRLLNKRTLYHMWRQAAAPADAADPLSELQAHQEGTGRLQVTLREQQDLSALFAHQITMLLADLKKASADNATLRSELAATKAAPPNSALPEPGSSVIVHGLKNMAALNGKHGSVVQGQTLKDGSNVVLIEFPKEADGTETSPTMLRRHNIFPTPPDSVLEVLREEPLAKLAEAQKRIAELEAQLADAPAAAAAAAATAAPAEAAVPAAELAAMQARLETGAERTRVLDAEVEALRKELDGFKGSDAAVDAASVSTNPLVSYSPVPMVGSRVIAHGLQSMESLNGKIGHVVANETLPDGTVVPKVQFGEPKAAVVIRRENTTEVPSDFVLQRLLHHLHQPLMAENDALKLEVATLQEQQRLALPAAGVAALPAVGATVVAHSLAEDAALNGRAGTVVQGEAELQGSTPVCTVRFQVPRPGGQAGEEDEVLKRLTTSNFDGMPRAEVCELVCRPAKAECADLREQLKRVQSDLVVARAQAAAQDQLASAPASPTLSASSPPPSGALEIGSRVLAHSLKNRSDLNGRQGTVLQKQMQANGKEAVVVEFEGAPPVKLALRPDNLADAPSSAVRALLEAPLRAKLAEAEAAAAVAAASAAAAGEEEKAAAALPEVGAAVVTHGLQGDAVLNYQQGTVREHRTLDDGSAVAVVEVRVAGDKEAAQVMLRADQVTAMPSEEAVRGIVREEQQRRKQAEAELEIERMNGSALKRASVSSPSGSGSGVAAASGELPEVGGYLVACDVQAMEHLNGRLGRVVEQKQLNDDTKLVVADVFDRAEEAEAAAAAAGGDDAGVGGPEVSTVMLKAHNVHPIPLSLYQAILRVNTAEPAAARAAAEGEAAALRTKEVADVRRIAELQEDVARLTAAVAEASAAAEAAAEAARAGAPPAPRALEAGVEVLVVPAKGGEGTEGEAALLQRATVVSKVDGTTVCVKLQGDRTSNLGTLFDASTLVVIPEAEEGPAAPPRPGAACVVRRADGTGHDRGVVVVGLEDGTVCVKLDGAAGAAHGAGTVVPAADVLVLPCAEAEEALCGALRAEAAAREARVAELEAKLCAVEEEQEKALKASLSHLSKIDSLLDQSKATQEGGGGGAAGEGAGSGAAGGSGCRFCDELRKEVHVLLAETERERTAQRARQERMLAALREQAQVRSDEEGRLFSAIEGLQRRDSVSPPRTLLPPSSPRSPSGGGGGGLGLGFGFGGLFADDHLFGSSDASLVQRVVPDGDLHNSFTALQGEKQQAADTLAAQEAALLDDYRRRVAVGADAADVVARAARLRAEAAAAREGLLRQELNLLQALHVRRAAERELLGTLEAAALRRQSELLEGQEVLRATLGGGGAGLRGIEEAVATHEGVERNLLKAVVALKEERLGAAAAPAAAAPAAAAAAAAALDDLDALIRSVADPRLRAVLEQMRREIHRSGGGGGGGGGHQQQELLTLLRAREEESAALRHRLAAVEAYPAAASAYDGAGGGGGGGVGDGGSIGRQHRSPSPVMRSGSPSAFSFDEISEMRRQLSEARENLRVMQGDHVSTSDGLSAATARVASLQGQVESLQNLTQAKQSRVDALTAAVTRVQQLPIIPDKARAILEGCAPLGEAEKVSWLFHHHDSTCNGRWSFEETSAARGITYHQWANICLAVGADPKGAGLTLGDVEGMYKLEEGNVLHAEYDTARGAQVAGVESLTATEAWVRGGVAAAEADERAVIEGCCAMFFTSGNPIRDALAGVRRETHLQRMENAEYEERMMSALLYKGNNVMAPLMAASVPRSPSPYAAAAAGSPPRSPRGGGASLPPSTHLAGPRGSPTAAWPEGAAATPMQPGYAGYAGYAATASELMRASPPPPAAASPPSAHSRGASGGGGGGATSELQTLVSMIDRLRDENASLEQRNLELAERVRATSASPLRSRTASPAGAFAIAPAGGLLRAGVQLHQRPGLGRAVACLLERASAKQLVARRYIQWRACAAARRGGSRGGYSYSGYLPTTAHGGGGVSGGGGGGGGGPLSPYDTPHAEYGGGYLSSLSQPPASPTRGYMRTQVFMLEDIEAASRRILQGAMEDNHYVLRVMWARATGRGGGGGSSGNLLMPPAPAPASYGSLVLRGGPTSGGTSGVPIDVYETASRQSVMAEEFGARVALVKWKLSDVVQGCQMAEVGGIVQALQHVVSGVAVPPEVRARFNRVRVAHGSLGTMQRRIADLEGKNDSLRTERNKALTQATAADQRLSEYRSRIHKLRDEARLRNEQSKASVGGGGGERGASTSMSPSPRRLANHQSVAGSPDKVARWTAELQPPKSWE